MSFSETARVAFRRGDDAAVARLALAVRDGVEPGIPRTP